ncbi:MAG: sulfatase [Planctomycetes bacterium]|nr:sulfatase [Planctomycetota bacterium]
MNRRTFLKALGAGAAALAVRPRWTAAAASRTRPNIVLIFADDLGWKDVGYQGTDYYETPNIDRLAREGMVFTAGYAAAGNCAPSRACLISGQYTPRHSVYAVSSTNRGPKSLMRMVPIPNSTDLAPENVSVAEAMKAAGYATGCFGKWHLGSPDKGTGAENQGFDTLGLVKHGYNSPDKDDPKGIFTITQAACDFMEKNKDRPFFAYVSHYAIHTALQARQATLDRFKQKTPGTQHKNALYAACTYDLDAGVGLLLKKLAELGLEENTLVAFTSDNGGTGQSSQEPLRGNKGCYYEGGTREPFIMRWPGVTKPGSRCDVPVINLDLYPTFLDAAGAPEPEGKVLDGESLVPLLRGEPALKRQAIFWHFPGYLDSPVTRGRDPVFRTRPVSVIHKGDWKLHLYHEEWVLDGGRANLDTNNAVELYNLADDIGERKNLATERRDKRDELLADLLAWFDAVKAPLPSAKNPDYNPDQAATEKKGGGRKKNPPQL